MTDWSDTRTVSILFCDLVGSTQFLTSVPPHTADRVRAAHFEVLREAVRGTGGDEVKNLGDGLMVTFVSARAAVHCAEEMQRGLQLLARRAPAAALGLRVGVATGEATHEEGDWFGVPVIEASRLCSAATGGQILVSDLVARLLGGGSGHELSLVGALQLKGLEDARTAWAVQWRAAPDSLRVVVADDDALLREGLARLLVELGMDVVASACDAVELEEHVERLRPDIVLTDVRMPPTHTTEGLEAARRIRADHPRIGIILLSQHVELTYARRLVEDDARAIGYLLKHRVADVAQLAAAVHDVAAGGVVLDSELPDELRDGARN